MMQKRTTKKTAVILLLAALLSASAISCGDDRNPGDSLQTGDNTDAVTTENAEEIPYAFAQSGLDFGGEKFRVFTELAEDVDVLREDLVAGDIVSEAVYERNLRVEELLNVQIESVPFAAIHWEDVPMEIMKNVMAGDDAYEAVHSAVISLFRASSESNLIALDEITTLDTSAPWWDKSIFEALDFGNGKVYLMNGGINYWDDYGLSCLAANIDLMLRNNLTPPFEAVRAGEWDYEMFYSYIQDIERDLNGNGDWDENDQYGGVYSVDLATSFCCAFDASPIQKDSDGRPALILDERFYDCFSTIIDEMCNDPAIVIMERKFGYEIGNQLFGMGNTMFTSPMVFEIQNLREVPFTYTILPMPKYDENQKSYQNITVHCYTFTYGVPITNSNLDMTGYVLDAMGYFGDAIIRPAAIEKQCKIKGAPDQDTVDMLNIIFDSKAYDLAYITGWGEWYTTMWQFVSTGKNTIASKEKALSKRVAKDIEKSLEAFGIE